VDTQGPSLQLSGISRTRCSYGTIRPSSSWIAPRWRLVRRVPDPADLRRQQVQLTDAGQALLDDLTQVHRDELRRFRTRMVDLLGALD
jgi:hypothetical protein